MKIRQLWKLNQQYLQETMVFRSRRFSGTCHEVMRKTELRRVPMRMLKCGVPRTKLMCQNVPNRCKTDVSAKRAVRFRNSAVLIWEIYLFKKWVAILLQHLNRVPFHATIANSQTTFFCSNLWKRGVDLGVFFLRSTAVFFAETNGRDRRDPLSLEKVMPPPWPPPNAVSWPFFDFFPDVNFWSNSQIKR